MDRHGHLLVEATPAAYREVGSFEIGGAAPPRWSPPVVSGGHVREQDTLYRDDIRDWTARGARPAPDA